MFTLLMCGNAYGQKWESFGVGVNPPDEILSFRNHVVAREDLRYFKLNNELHTWIPIAPFPDEYFIPKVMPSGWAILTNQDSIVRMNMETGERDVRRGLRYDVEANDSVVCRIIPSRTDCYFSWIRFPSGQVIATDSIQYDVGLIGRYYSVPLVQASGDLLHFVGNVVYRCKVGGGILKVTLPDTIDIDRYDWPCNIVHGDSIVIAAKNSIIATFDSGLTWKTIADGDQFDPTKDRFPTFVPDSRELVWIKNDNCLVSLDSDQTSIDTVLKFVLDLPRSIYSGDQELIVVSTNQIQYSNNGIDWNIGPVLAASGATFLTAVEDGIAGISRHLVILAEDGQPWKTVYPNLQPYTPRDSSQIGGFQCESFDRFSIDYNGQIACFKNRGSIPLGITVVMDLKGGYYVSDPCTIWYQAYEPLDGVAVSDITNGAWRNELVGRKSPSICGFSDGRIVAMCTDGIYVREPLTGNWERMPAPPFDPSISMKKVVRGRHLVVSYQTKGKRYFWYSGDGAHSWHRLADNDEFTSYSGVYAVSHSGKAFVLASDLEGRTHRIYDLQSMEPVTPHVRTLPEEYVVAIEVDYNCKNVYLGTNLQIHKYEFRSTSNIDESVVSGHMTYPSSVFDMLGNVVAEEFHPEELPTGCYFVWRDGVVKQIQVVR